MPALYQAAVADGRTNLWGTPLAFLEPERSTRRPALRKDSRWPAADSQRDPERRPPAPEENVLGLARAALQELSGLALLPIRTEERALEQD